MTELFIESNLIFYFLEVKRLLLKSLEWQTVYQFKRETKESLITFLILWNKSTNVSIPPKPFHSPAHLPSYFLVSYQILWLYCIAAIPLSADFKKDQLKRRNGIRSFCDITLECILNWIQRYIFIVYYLVTWYAFRTNI